MQEPLPTTFRINPTSKFVGKVRRDLDRIWTQRSNILVPGREIHRREEDGSLSKVTMPSKVVSALHPVDFIPGQRAYQIDVNKKELKEYLRTTRRKKKNTFFENFGRKVACIANPDTNSIGMDASPPQISSEAEEVLREMNSLTQQSDPFGKLI